MNLHRTISAFIVLAVTGTLPAAAPNVTHLFPSGAKRGTTCEITAGGTFERWPVKGWANDKGITLTPAKDKGTLNVTVAADIAPGTHWLRLHDDQGARRRRVHAASLAEHRQSGPTAAPEEEMRKMTTRLRLRARDARRTREPQAK